MNYDLALMALEGLARAPLSVAVEKQELIVEGESAGFKELARLCLLLAGGQDGTDGVELLSGVHLTAGSPPMRLRLRIQ